MTLPQRIYWRRIGYLWHGFRRTRDGGVAPFRSLCGQRALTRIGSQDVMRPAPVLRCSQCDVEEMRLRGWDESGPEEAHGG